MAGASPVVGVDCGRASLGNSSATAPGPSGQNKPQRHGWIFISDRSNLSGQFMGQPMQYVLPPMRPTSQMSINVLRFLNISQFQYLRKEKIDKINPTLETLEIN